MADWPFCIGSRGWLDHADRLLEGLDAQAVDHATQADFSTNSEVTWASSCHKANGSACDPGRLGHRERRAGFVWCSRGPPHGELLFAVCCERLDVFVFNPLGIDATPALHATVPHADDFGELRENAVEAVDEARSIRVTEERAIAEDAEGQGSVAER